MSYSLPYAILSRIQLTFCLLIFSLPLHSAPKDNAEEALIQAEKQMEHKIKRISFFHHSARSSMKESLQLPQFEAYFNLPESRSYYHDDMGRIQLTQKQNEIRMQMEEWILALHARFPIGETCLIDNHGQEHLRVVGGDIKKSHLFSAEEHGAPFFEPTFKLKEGEVYMSDPYFSEDTQYWSTSFTSPIYLKNGSIPGFYHFEIPLKAYSDLISFKDFSFSYFKGNELDEEEEGRYFIINKDNLVLADSERDINFNLPDERNPDINMELPDYLPPEKIKDYVTSVSKIFPQQDGEKIAREMHQKGKGTLYMNMMGREYLLIFVPVPDRPDWILGHLDPIGGTGYWENKK